MKKISIVLAMLLLMGTATACGKKAEPSPTPMKTNSPAPDLPDSIEDAGEDMKNGAENIGEDIKEGVKDTGDTIKNVGEEMKEDMTGENK